MNKLTHQRMISTSFLIAIFALVFYNIYYCIDRNRIMSERTNITTSYQTIRAANQTLLSIQEALLRLNTFALTKDSNVIKRIPEIIKAAELNFQTLFPLISDNNEEESLYNKTKPLFDDQIKLITQTYVSDAAGNAQPPIALDQILDNMSEYLLLTKAREIQQLNDSNIKVYNYRSHLQNTMVVTNLISAIFFILGLALLNNYFKKY